VSYLNEEDLLPVMKAMQKKTTKTSRKFGAFAL
jgi:hypothetical protein